MSRIKAWFLRFLGELGDFLKVLLQRGVVEELNAILPIALEAVKAVQAENLSGEEKRALAISIIKSKIAKASYQTATSVINLAIELAVQKLKAFQDSQKV